MTNNDENQPPQWINIDQSDSWCETDLKAQKMSKTGIFIWKISGFMGHRDNFENCRNMDSISDSVKSREFTVRAPDGRETKWQLQCIPRYQRDFVKVFVVSRNKFEVKAMVTLCVNTEEWDLGNHGCSDSSFKFTGTSLDAKCVWTASYPDTLVPWTNDTGGNPLTYLPNGDLTFICEIAILGPFKSTFGSKKWSNSPPVPALADPSLKVCENLDEFYLSKELSDVLIECKDKKFEAHQVILSSRSPVFRGMFQADMKEKKSQHVEVKDLEPDLVAEMLKFIYTGSCVATEENPDLDMVSDLLVASDKYQIVTLKNVCQTLLSSHLVVENALKFLVLGDMYGADKLKEPAMGVVINNMSGLIGTEEWKECKKKSPYIFVEVAEAIAKSAS